MPTRGPRDPGPWNQASHRLIYPQQVVLFAADNRHRGTRKFSHITPNSRLSLPLRGRMPALPHRRRHRRRSEHSLWAEPLRQQQRPEPTHAVPRQTDPIRGQPLGLQQRQEIVDHHGPRIDTLVRGPVRRGPVNGSNRESGHSGLLSQAQLSESLLSGISASMQKNHGATNRSLRSRHCPADILTGPVRGLQRSRQFFARECRS